MVFPNRKRKVMTLDERLDAIEMSKQGISARKIAMDFNVGKTQVQNIIRNKETILDKEGVGLNKKRKRILNSRYANVNKLVWGWFCFAREKGLRITRTLLKSKALDFSRELGESSFTASNGWLNSFKTRHHISSSTLKNEKFDETVHITWKNTLDSIIERYAPEDIYCASETGLYFRALPANNAVMRCLHGQRCEERLTLLLSCNASGNKLEPFIIGQATMEYITTGVQYRQEGKSWMTSDLFNDWLNMLNMEMELAEREIVLLLNTSSVHLCAEKSNVRLVFIPSNTTKNYQPCNAGIIQTIKLQYRKIFLSRISCDVSLANEITIADAIAWIQHAWEKISANKIKKCFQDCGINNSTLCVTEIDDDINDEVKIDDNELSPILNGISLQQYAEHDNSLATSYDSEEDVVKGQQILVTQPRNTTGSSSFEDDEGTDKEHQDDDEIIEFDRSDREASQFDSEYCDKDIATDNSKEASTRVIREINILSNGCDASRNAQNINDVFIDGAEKDEVGEENQLNRKTDKDVDNVNKILARNETKNDGIDKGNVDSLLYGNNTISPTVAAYMVKELIKFGIYHRKSDIIDAMFKVETIVEQMESESQKSLTT